MNIFQAPLGFWPNRGVMEFPLKFSRNFHPGFFFFSLYLWRLCEGKTLSSHQATISGETPRRSETAPFIFSLFVVTVTVTHPQSYRTLLLFLLTPWIMDCCHSWLALNHLPLVFYFEWGFIGFLSRLCVENDLELEPTSAVKIKIGSDLINFLFLIGSVCTFLKIDGVAVT